jgi:hypothetical protein
MQTHLPAPCYQGPRTRTRGWWPQAVEACMNHRPVPIGNVHPDEAVPSLSDPNIRADLVRRIRSEIAAGTYETPEKWEAALDRLLDLLEGA